MPEQINGVTWAPSIPWKRLKNTNVIFNISNIIKYLVRQQKDEWVEEN
jgi:hypothetical protein